MSTTHPPVSHDEMVVIGKIGSAYGIKGWVKVNSFTDPIDNILHYSSFYLRDPKATAAWSERKVVQGRVHGKGIVVQLQEISDRNQAELLRGLEIAVPRASLPAPDEGEFYWIDLLGMAVRNTDSVDLGVIDNFMETGANDVMVVKGERERLIPFVLDHVIKDIDLEHGVVVVDWDPEF